MSHGKLGLGISLLAIAASMVVPEVRKFVGLDPSPSVQTFTRNDQERPKEPVKKPVQDSKTPTPPVQQQPQQAQRQTCIAVGMGLGEGIFSQGREMGFDSETPLLLAKSLQQEGFCARVVPTAAFIVMPFHMGGRPISGKDSEPLNGYSYASLITIDEQDLLGSIIAADDAIFDRTGNREEPVESRLTLKVSVYQLPSAQLLDVVRHSAPLDASYRVDVQNFQDIAKQITAIIPH